MCVCVCVPYRRWWQRCIKWVRGGAQQTKDLPITEPQILDYPHSPQFVRRAPVSCTNALAIATPPIDPVPSRPPRKWPTPWYWQFMVLVVRTFRQSRHVILSRVLLVQTLLITLVCSLLWFQVLDEEDSIEDRYGLVSPHTLLISCAVSIVSIRAKHATVLYM